MHVKFLNETHASMYSLVKESISVLQNVSATRSFLFPFELFTAVSPLTSGSLSSLPLKPLTFHCFPTHWSTVQDFHLRE